MKWLAPFVQLSITPAIGVAMYVRLSQVRIGVGLSENRKKIIDADKDQRNPLVS